MSIVDEQVYRAVVMGELRVDPDGSIWRIAARRANRWTGGTTTIRCEPRRAEIPVSNGYRMVRVMIDGRRYCALAHRIVWRHFCGPIPDGLTINHKNGHRADNRPSNFELATQSEQMFDAMRRGYDPGRNLPHRRGATA